MLLIRAWRLFWIDKPIDETTEITPRLDSIAIPYAGYEHGYFGIVGAISVEHVGAWSRAMGSEIATGSSDLLRVRYLKDVVSILLPTARAYS